MINCILVDDNKLARIALKQIISQVEEIHLVKECESAMEAYNLIQKESVDLIFLDIEMPGISGLEFAKQLTDKKVFIIFTTANSEYAIDAFELNVVDYLIKPVELSRFLNAVEKVKDLIKTKSNPLSQTEDEFFFVKDKGSLIKLSLHDILFFEAMGDYVKVHSNEKSYMVHSTLKIVEQKLNPSNFIRTHRSYIISLNKIDRIENGSISINKHIIPVADSYKILLNQKIKQF